MKTKLISLVVAVVMVVSDFSVVLAAGIIISPVKRRNYDGAPISTINNATSAVAEPQISQIEQIVPDVSEKLSYCIIIRRRNYEPQAPEEIDQLAYIILGGPRRRNYESAVSTEIGQLAYIIFSGGTRRRNYECNASNKNDQLAYIFLTGGTRRRNYEGIKKEDANQLAYIIIGPPRRRNYGKHKLECLV